MSIRLKRIGRTLRQELGGALVTRRFRKEVRKSDVFVLSYPKSGTHWAGFFFAALAARKAGGDSPEITFRNWQEWTPLFELTSKDCLRIRPLRNRPDPRVLLTHDPFDPVVPRAILLVRDPRAVLLSYFHHYHRTRPGFHGDIRRFALEMLQGKLWPCDWGQHVRGWRDHLGEDRLIVLRFEDLKADPGHWFARALDFVGLEADEGEMGYALNQSSYEHMKSVEMGHGMKGSEGDQAVPFMRSGATDAWLSELPEEVVSVVEFAYREQMEELGYLEPSRASSGAADRE